jgi:hypothetical protein
MEDAQPIERNAVAFVLGHRCRLDNFDVVLLEVLTWEARLVRKSDTGMPDLREGNLWEGIRRGILR